MVSHSNMLGWRVRKWWRHKSLQGCRLRHGWWALKKKTSKIYDPNQIQLMSWLLYVHYLLWQFLALACLKVFHSNLIDYFIINMQSSRKGRFFGLEKIGMKKIPEHVRCHKQTDLERAKATLLLASMPKSLPCRNKYVKIWYIFIFISFCIVLC